MLSFISCIVLIVVGVVGDVRTSNMWELERGVPVFLNGYNTGIMSDGNSYTFEQLYDNVPIMYFNMLWATDEFSFDVSENHSKNISTISN